MVGDSVCQEAPGNKSLQAAAVTLHHGGIPTKESGEVEMSIHLPVWDTFENVLQDITPAEPVETAERGKCGIDLKKKSTAGGHFMKQRTCQACAKKPGASTRPTLSAIELLLCYMCDAGNLQYCFSMEQNCALIIHNRQMTYYKKCCIAPSGRQRAKAKEQGGYYLEGIPMQAGACRWAL